MSSPTMPPSLFNPEVLNSLAPSFGIYQPESAPSIILPAKPEIRVLEDRWYQIQALEEIDRRFPIHGKRQGGKGEMLVSPTGCGKTSIASRAIKKWQDRGERVLILVDLERLLDQMFDDLQLEDINPLIEKAEHHAIGDFGRHGNVVLASMQTLYTERLKKWPKDSFDKIVIDECHELRWLPIIKHFESAQYLGLTATPIRADGKSLKTYFHYPYIQTLTLRQAIEGWNGITQKYEKPFLSRILIKSIPAQHIDLTGIKLVNEKNKKCDFDQSELDKTIWQHTNFLASAILDEAGDRPTWIYCPRIHTAEAIATALRDMGAAADAYTSKTPDPKALLNQFIDGKLQYLTNVNMLIKGVNVPKVSCVARVRVSLNIGAATQEIGRSTRLHPLSGKKDALILEFDFKTGDKYKLASVIDAILDGNFEADKKPTKAEIAWKAKVKDKAERIIKTGEEMDVIRALDKAKKDVSEEEAAERQRKIDAKRAKYERVETNIKTEIYDPFAGLNKEVSSSDRSGDTQPATPEQIALLHELSGGVVPGQKMSTGAADERIKQLETRKKYKYASEKQVRMMINTMGCDPAKANRMKKWEASEWINNECAAMVNTLCEHGYDFDAAKALKPWELVKASTQYRQEKAE